MLFRKLSILVTDQCNAACEICCLNCSPQGKNTLTTEDMQRVIREARELPGLEEICFTGGEPLLYEDRVEACAAFARELGLKSSVYTNGFWGKDAGRAREWAAGLKKSGVYKAHFSADPWHQQYVPFSALETAMRACREAGLLTELAVMETRESNHWQAVQAALPGEAGAARVFIHPLLPVGRARGSVKEVAYERCFSTNDASCWYGQNAALTADGYYYPCCTMYFSEIAGIRLGHMNEISCADLEKAALGNDFLYLMLREGFGWYMRRMRETGREVPESVCFPCACCDMVFNDPAFLEEIAGEVHARAEKMRRGEESGTSGEKKEELMMTATSHDRKFKACSPGETVERIRGILETYGIETEGEIENSGVGTISSIRITIKGTGIGQNGKGTDPDYALASGYAEFLERLQTGYLLPEGVNEMPGREWLTREELKERGGTLLRKSLARIRKTDGGSPVLPVDVDDYLEKWSFDRREDGRSAAIPFEREADGEKAWLPENILRAYYFTNGSCAGNCREEAFIQGMSEITERYAELRILRERLTPPVIPDEAIEAWPVLRDAVGSIRASGRYSLRLMDASCGIGLPAACAILADLQTGRVVLRFGAHPRFEIAVERCLTEILQGRHIARLEDAPLWRIENDAAADGFINLFNVLKSASGAFPAEMALDTPSWAWHPFAPVSGELADQLAFMKDLYGRLGWELWVRDCSFTGFPVYQLLVPGVSMAFDFGAKRLAEKRLTHVFRENMRTLKTATPEILEKVRTIALLRRQYVIEDQFSYFTGLPAEATFLDVPLDAGIIAALCSMALGDNKTAAKLLRGYCFHENGRRTQVFPLAQLAADNGSEKARAANRAFCPRDWAEKAEEIYRDPRASLAFFEDAPEHIRVTDQTEKLRQAIGVMRHE